MIDQEKFNLPDGHRLQAFLSVDSTNKEAIRQMEAGGGSDGLWILSDAQTGGRGRRGREWVSKPGNIYCSLIHEASKDTYTSSQLSFVTSLAVRDTVAQFTDDECAVKCKWPNDVLVNGQKISGILLETYSKTVPEQNFVIIGIGINIEHHPDIASYPATHLNAHSGEHVGSINAFTILVEKTAYWIDVWQKEGFEAIRKKWLENCKGFGKEIRVKLPDKEIVGRFIDLNGDGGLKLDMGGETKLIHSGEVFFADTAKD